MILASFQTTSWQCGGAPTGPTVYEHAASTCVVAPSYLRSDGFLYEGYVIPYVMPTERCPDIDTEFDFKIVEFLMKEKYQ